MAEADSNPNTACGGTAAEMVYPGGELAFIMHIVEESVRLGARVHWYSTMVGKKTTLKALRKELHSRHVTAIRTTEFAQVGACGTPAWETLIQLLIPPAHSPLDPLPNPVSLKSLPRLLAAQGKTSRWAIAWSFEVDPNLANQPLPRAANVALATPVRPKRLISFTLQVWEHGSVQIGRRCGGRQCRVHLLTLSYAHQGGQDGRKLLKAMEAALVAHGATGAAVDMGMWALTAGQSVGRIGLLPL